MQKWWNYRAVNAMSAFITKITPPLIVWDLWRSRCAKKYGAEAPSLNRSVVLVSFTVSVGEAEVWATESGYKVGEPEAAY